MTQYFCILSGAVTSVKIKHVFILPGTGLDQAQEFPPPRFLIVEDDANRPEAGALLFRFDGEADCVGDTWHSSMEKAKQDAADEYEGLVQSWTEVFPEMNTVELAKDISQKCKSNSQ
jgi:hypothetical protein